MFSRVAGVAILIAFLLILVTCGLLLWTQKSARVHPFLVSINQITGQWEVVGHQHGNLREITTTQALQEAVIGDFVRNWFLVTDDADVNERSWQSCDRVAQCNPKNKTGVDTNLCAVYCISSDELYNKFSTDVIPGYRARMQIGETLITNMPSLKITPIGEVFENGGMWLVRFSLRSNKNQNINVLGYAKIARNMEAYPKTLGYYMADFNAYNINK